MASIFERSRKAAEERKNKANNVTTNPPADGQESQVDTYQQDIEQSRLPATPAPATATTTTAAAPKPTAPAKQPNRAAIAGHKPTAPSTPAAPATDTPTETEQVTPSTPAAPAAVTPAPAKQPVSKPPVKTPPTTAPAPDLKTRETIDNIADQNDVPPDQADKAKNAVLDPDSKRPATFADSLKLVLGIDEKTKDSTKLLKYLLLGVSAFGNGFVGRDDPLMQAALNDFRAKRDADIRTDEADAKKADEIANTIKQWQAEAFAIADATSNDRNSPEWNEAYDKVIISKQEQGNVAEQQALLRAQQQSQTQAEEAQRKLAELGINANIDAKKIDMAHQNMMQDKEIANGLNMLDAAHQNTLAQVLAAADVEAKAQGRAVQEMAKAIGAYDEKKGKIKWNKFGDTINKMAGQTFFKLAYDASLRIAEAGIKAVAGAMGN